MRLHHLSVTAFGPFPDTVEVDFDALSASGLFLLTGATGAGKTSVLDAVCFALYGQVPGDRAGAKHLRSDHAPPDREPRVVLDLSIGDRRLRFTRSPAWSRPKRRGSGTTNAPAHVLVEERRDGSWTGLTNRLEDAGLLVGDLLGMNCTQFTQVAMLPQGRFQAFLRATSAERHDVLQKLFRTDRFERVERWLVERRVDARRQMEAGEADVRAVLTRLEESGAVALPEDWADTLTEASDDGRVAAWTGSLARSAAETLAAAEKTFAAAQVAENAAAARLAEARTHAALVRRGQAAEEVLRAHEDQTEERARERRRLERSRAAAPLTTQLRRNAGLAREAEAAARRWADRRDDLATLLPGLDHEPDRDALAAAHAEAMAELAQARAFVPREREREASSERRRRVSADRQRIAAALSAATVELETLPEQALAAEERYARTELAAGLLAEKEARVEHLVTLSAADVRARQVEHELAVARAELRAATEAAQSARERYLDIREARINGMAAELAGGLAAGCHCPVCGSAEHPAPARSTTSSVGREEENDARRLHEDAVVAELGHQGKVAGLEAEATALATQLAGTDRKGLSDALVRARADAGATRADAEDGPAAARELAGLRTALTDATERSQGLAVRAAALDAELSEVDATLEALNSERLLLLGDRAADLDALLHRCTRVVEALAAAQTDLAEARSAHDAATRAATALTDAAAEAGFSGPAEAVDALLAPAAETAIEEALAAAEAARLAAVATLAEPEVLAAMNAEGTDITVAQELHEEAVATARAAAAAVEAARSRLARLGELDADLDEALAAWVPLRARYRTVADLAALVEGRSVDNPLRMRLAAYVLAERLRQVVAAANERLGSMTGGRFTLEHVLDRGAGEQRGGLSLRVRDAWNGVERDPATLSGGETFVVSLALALGLADTVAHEAGGTDIDTLFIDEGFGSLDADTLEDVMDTLDALRDGGRTVGLVSHVPELRSRITTQLEVSKGRSGSTLRPVLVHG